MPGVMLATLYARFSPRPNAEECDSTKKQIERCSAYCAANAYEIRGIFKDDNKSGAQADNRPGLQSALAQACELKSVLVCYDLSRLARSTKDAIAIADRLQAAGANLAFLDMRLDTSSPTGRCFFTILAAFAQMQRESTATRTKTAMRKYMAEGRCMGTVPYGYRRNGAMLEIAPAEQDILAKIRVWRAEGRDVAWMQRELNAHHAGAARTGEWHRSMIGNLVRRG